MPSFRYTAVTQSGETQHGVMDAADEAAVVRALQQQGSIPMRAEPAGPAQSGLLRLLNLKIGAGGLGRPAVADMTRELAVMLGAGLDLDRALRFLVETAPSRTVATALERIRATVRDGGSLTAALTEQPESFPAVYVGMVRAGEAGGRLAPTLERLAGLLERQRSLVSGIRSALIYPAVLVVAAIGSMVLLLTQVLPQFTPLFAQNGARLPASTQFVVDAGDALSAYGMQAALLLLLAAVIARMALRRPAPRLAFDRLLLRLPIVGGMMKEVLAARFSRTFGTLLVNGVPLIAALDVARDTMGNRAAAHAIEQATRAARGGDDLSVSLLASGLFPLRLPTLLRLGHETAQLGPMSLRAAEIHEEASRLGLQRMVALLVPAITIVMGALIAGIVASLLLAMLSLNDLAG